MPIMNKERFPDVMFHAPDKFKPVGALGGATLIEIGVTEGDSEPVVAQAYTATPENEELYPAYLHEILAHSPDVVLNDELEA